MDVIETARLHLRQFTPGDLGDMYPIFSDPEVVKYMKTGAPVSKAETESALMSIIKHWKQHGFGRWAVVSKETGKLIGYGGLRNLYGTPELVYLLARPYWGIGLATEVAKACLKWGFEERHFERIVAVTKPEHAASRRIMEKIGMIYERDATYYDIHVVLYTISRSTYQSITVLNKFPLACVADSSSTQNPSSTEA
jgi:RimJ/RimL family protein N-acetyltransferase